MFIFQDNFGANIQILTNKRHTVHSGLQGLTKTENINNQRHYVPTREWESKEIN